MIIAIDFDGTIVRNKFPEPLTAEDILPYAKEMINSFHRLGITIILWTCRHGKPLEDAIDFMEKHKIAFDCVNCNAPENLQKYGDIDNRKVYADIYIDDRNVGGMLSWPQIYAKVLLSDAYMNMIRGEKR